MNKRILSFLLVLCMILVSVPVFALSTAAAGNETKVYEHTSSYSDNLPYDGTGKNGAWVVGNKWASTAASSFAQISWLGTSGNYNQIATKSNVFVNIANTVNANNFYGPVGSVGAVPGEDAAVRYVAEKSGIIDIAFDKLGNGATLVGGTYHYAVYVDGAKVWPTDSDWYTIEKVANGETISDPNNGELTCYDDIYVFEETTVVATGISVAQGSVVDFICRAEVDSYKTTWSTGGNEIFPTILYSFVQATHTTSYSDKVNAPTQANNAVVYKGNWTAHTYTPGSYGVNNVKLINWAGTSGNYNNLATSGGSAFLSWNNSNGNYHGAIATVGAHAAESALIRYTAEYDGVANISFDKLGNLAKLASGTFTYNVYLNGTKIWPLNGETNTATAATTIYSTKTQIVANLTLKAGDKIDFTCDGSASYTSPNFLWGAGGNAMFATIDYTEVFTPAAYSTSYSDTKNTPTQEGGVPVFHGNWTVMTTRAGVGTYNSDLIPISWAATSGNYNGLATSGGEAFVSWNSTNPNYYGALGAVGATQTQAAVVRYTAEKNGVANISFDKLGMLAADSDATATFTYTVYVNGVKVWPLSGETNSVQGIGQISTGKKTYIYETKTTIVAGITLAIGDKIDFVCEATGVDNANTNELWGAGGNAMFATIDYTSVMEAPTASATVTVGSTVSATANVTMPKNVWFPAETGVYVDGVKLTDEDNKFLTNVAIKDITNTVTVQPYYITTQGAEIKGAVSTVSVAQLLAGVAGSNAQAAAVLNYAAAAQQYFLITGTDLTYTDAVVTGTYTDQLGIVGEKFEGARVAPQQASLLLKESVSFKFTVKGATEGDKMEMYNGDTLVDTVAIVDGEVAIDGITVGDWNTLYTFRVVDADGNAVSWSFTYSVSTYYARILAQGEDGNMIALVSAMMALYESAQAL